MLLHLLIESKLLLGRGVHNSEQKFTINTNVIKYIQNTGTGEYSYTFNVAMDEPTDKVENIVFSFSNDSTYKAALVAYDLAQNDIEALKNHKSVDYTGKVGYEFLEGVDFPLEGESGKVYWTSDNCITVVNEYCSCNTPGHIHGNYENCNCHVIEYLVICSPLGIGNPGGGYDGDPNPGPGDDPGPPPSGGGSGGGNTTPTAPILDIDYQQEVEDCLKPEMEDNGFEGDPLSGNSEENNWGAWLYQDDDDDDQPDNFLDIRDLANFLADNDCSEEAQGFGEAAAEAFANDEMTPEEFDIAVELFYELEANPYKLLEIDCNQLPNWQDLAQHTPPQSVNDKIENLHENNEAMLGDWDIQYLDEAGGAVVNMDYFAVNITSFPTDPATGQPFTADGFLDYFRDNINSFCSPTSFEPYCEISAICQQETDLWNSNDPLGAIVKLNIPMYDGWGGDTFGNDGVVICSEFQNDYWYFMTIEAPYDGNHPVSGTRQFGYEINADGSYNFFVRGVDRFYSGAIFSVLNFFKDNPFFGADALWETFQQEISSYVNSNGGSASIENPITNRPDWEMVEDVLMGNRPIGDLGCN